jgi:hypothetical protein
MPPILGASLGCASLRAKVAPPRELRLRGVVESSGGCVGVCRLARMGAGDGVWSASSKGAW